MTKRILIIQGHPDPGGRHLDHALAEAYAAGAAEAGHELRTLTVAELDFPLLRSREDWEHGEPVPAIREAQQALLWAEHLLIVYPLWLGDLPALLKGFLEQVLRPGFAFGQGVDRAGPRPLAGRSARVVVTMGMPGFVYRLYFRAHSLKSLERNILRFCGIKPVRTTVLGMVESGGEPRHQQWLAHLRELGRAGR